jgi:hypothetical protein
MMLVPGEKLPDRSARRHESAGKVADAGKTMLGRHVIRMRVAAQQIIRNFAYTRGRSRSVPGGGLRVSRAIAARLGTGHEPLFCRRGSIREDTCYSSGITPRARLLCQRNLCISALWVASCYSWSPKEASAGSLGVSVSLLLRCLLQAGYYLCPCASS